MDESLRPEEKREGGKRSRECLHGRREDLGDIEIIRSKSKVCKRDLDKLKRMAEGKPKLVILRNYHRFERE